MAWQTGRGEQVGSRGPGRSLLRGELQLMGPRGVQERQVWESPGPFGPHSCYSRILTPGVLGLLWQPWSSGPRRIRMAICWAADGLLKPTPFPGQEFAKVSKCTLKTLGSAHAPGPGCWQQLSSLSWGTARYAGGGCGPQIQVLRPPWAPCLPGFWNHKGGHLPKPTFLWDLLLSQRQQIERDVRSQAMDQHHTNGQHPEVSRPQIHFITGVGGGRVGLLGNQDCHSCINIMLTGLPRGREEGGTPARAVHLPVHRAAISRGAWRSSGRQELKG